jgi:hypothetical protein
MRSIKQIGTSHPEEPIGDAANYRGMTLQTHLAAYEETTVSGY